MIFKIYWDSLVPRYTGGENFHEDPVSFSRKYEANCGKMLYHAMLKNPSKIPRSGYRCGWILKKINGN